MGRKLLAEKMWTLVPAQGIIAEHMKSLQEWPPRQRAESLSLQKATEAVMRQAREEPRPGLVNRSTRVRSPAGSPAVGPRIICLRRLALSPRRGAKTLRTRDMFYGFGAE